MKAMSKTGSIVTSLCELIIGILLLIEPKGFTRGILVFLGIVLLIMGISSIVQYFREKPEMAAAGQRLARGLIGIAAGLFLAIGNKWFIATFPALTILYGVGILIVGLAKVQLTADMIRLKVKKWFWAAISAILTIICAAIIICSPFRVDVLWIFIAVTLIVEAIVDVISLIFARPDRAEQ